MASVLSGVMDDTDRIAFTVSEAKKINLVIQAPNINQSEYQFSISDNNTITYGLGAIKGVGEALVQAIVAERIENGEYQDIFDFCLRIEKKFLNRRAIEALIYSGAFDSLGVDRAILIATYPSATRQAEQRQNDHFNGQGGLFTAVESHIDYEKKYLSADCLSFKKMLMFEKSVMGYYLHRHPTDAFTSALKSIVCTLPKNLIFRNNREVRILALVSEIRYRNTQKGQMASVVIEDGVKQLNAVLFTKALGENSEQLHVDEVVVITGKVNKDFRDQWQVVVDKVEGVEQVQMKYAKYLRIGLNTNQQGKYQKLSQLLKEHHGKCPVIVEYKTESAYGRMPLKPEYSVAPTASLLESLERLIGQGGCKVQY
jgi:DNA polymerase-3 subunit alpha